MNFLCTKTHAARNKTEMFTAMDILLFYAQFRFLSCTKNRIKYPGLFYRVINDVSLMQYCYDLEIREGRSFWMVFFNTDLKYVHDATDAYKF